MDDKKKKKKKKKKCIVPYQKSTPGGTHSEELIRSATSNTTMRPNESYVMETAHSSTQKKENASESLHSQSHSQPQSPPKNVVRLCSSSQSKCGYCQGKRAPIVRKTKETCSKSYGLLAERVSPADYETLIYRGWRRSGLHLYKPDNWSSCCPALSIRLEAQRFRISKSQKKVLKTMDRALAGPTITNITSIRSNGNRNDSCNGNGTSQLCNRNRNRNSTSIAHTIESCGVLQQLQQWTQHTLSQYTQSTIETKLCKFKIQKGGKKPKIDKDDNGDDIDDVVVLTTACAAVAGRSKGALKHTLLTEEVVKVLSSFSGCSQTNAKNTHTEWRFPFQVRSISRHEQSGQVMVILQYLSLSPEAYNDNVEMKLASFGEKVEIKDIPGATGTSTIATAKTEDMLENWLQSKGQSSSAKSRRPYNITIVSLPAHESALMPEVHQLYATYQHAVHGDLDPYSCNEEAADSTTSDQERKSDTDKDHDSHKDDTESASAAEASRMLQTVYGTKHTATEMKHIQRSYFSFYRFLVESPFPLQKINEKDNTNGTTSENLPPGTYHQHYRVNGKLIVVGVVDILPHGVSSVYAFYDPVLSKQFSLGKYAILKEIEWTQRSTRPYYYLGYYIESCPKMRYKADYYPSELLCPTNFKWLDAVKAKQILHQHSPERHCCTLVAAIAPAIATLKKYNHSDDHNFSSLSPPPSTLPHNDNTGDRDNNHEEEHGKSNDAPTSTLAANAVLLDVGAANHFTLDMLHINGQVHVRPLICEFVDEVGLDVSRRCVIKFAP